ncbi:MAG: ribbon-helix-helix domain-containing protein [Burkholderiales bacterium]
MPLVVRLDPELEAGLRTLSAEERIPRAELVRKLIRERLAHPNRRRNAFDVAQEMGVVGMDDDPRRDVARKHSIYVKKALRAKRTA